MNVVRVPPIGSRLATPLTVDGQLIIPWMIFKWFTRWNISSLYEKLSSLYEKLLFACDESMRVFDNIVSLKPIVHTFL